MTNKSKILYIVTKSVWAGAGKYTYDLATALPQTRFRAMAAAGGKGVMAEKIISAGIQYFEIKSFQRDVSFLKDIFVFFEILSLLFKTKPDIIHVSSAKAGGIAGAAAFVYKLIQKLKTKNCKLKTVFTAHGWTFNELRPKWQIILIKFFSKITCLFYDKVICVSEYDYNLALKDKIAPPKKLAVIHNGIKPEEYNFLSNEEAKKALKTNLGTQFPSTSIIIGTVGEFTKNKGQKYLIDAIKKVFSIQYSVVSIVIGFDGGEKSNLEAKILNSKLEENVFLIENLSGAGKYLKAFDIFVLPALKEGLPYVLLEAGLAELPIIATNVGGIPEIVENGVSGILINSASADELATEIKKLIENPDLCRNFSAAAREKILKEFSFKKMLDKTIDSYLKG